MTTLVAYTSPQASPPLLGSPWPGSEWASIRQNVRRAATVPLIISVGVQWVSLVAYGVPETTGLPTGPWWLAQLAPLAVAGPHWLGAVVLLLAAIGLFALSRTRHWVGRSAMLVPAALGAVTAALLVASLLVSGSAGTSALGILLLLAWVVAAWYAALHGLLVDLGAPPPRTRRTGTLLLAAWLLLLPGPLALGRLLLARDLRAQAEVLGANTVALRYSALLSGASVRLYLFGALLGLVVWLAYQCWPRAGVSRSWRWYLALVVAVVGLASFWWSAQSSAAHRVTQLRYGTPATELHLSCGTWVYPPPPGTPAETPTTTVAVSGVGCRTVSTFSGYRQVGRSVSPVSLSPVALRPAPTGSAALGTATADAPPLRVPLVGARYGSVLVLAASDRTDRVADQLVAVRLRGGAGQPLWRFSCADKREVRARFPGGLTEPDAAAPVPPEPDVAAAVVLTCGSERLRVDPVTGLTV